MTYSIQATSYIARNYQIVKAIYSYLEEVPLKSPAGVQIVECRVKSESEG